MRTELPTIDNYRDILLGNKPLLDVRAPIEFAKGSFPGAINLPLLDDRQRQKVGTRYKQQGNEAAVALGHELIRGEARQERIQAWRQFAKANPDGCLYCFRGGQRSSLAQRWLNEAGVVYPRIRGGYKAMRSFLLAELERIVADAPIRLLGGRTGVGKTEVLPAIEQHIDLEALANHRGSGFGRQPTPQPAQIDFENELIIQLMRWEQGAANRLPLEDESRCIGSRSIPQSLWDRMRAAPVIILRAPLEERALRIRAEYVDQMREQFEQNSPGTGWDRLRQHLQDSLDRIARRLGGALRQQLSEQVDRALAEQRGSGDDSGHLEWISTLLTRYYDPMYDYQLARKRDRIVFTGDARAVIAYLNQA